MFKSYLIIASLFITTLSGCAGISNRFDTEITVCEKCVLDESHDRYEWEVDKYKVNNSLAIIVPTMSEITNSIGKPDKIEKIENKEVWTYYKFRWIGTMPILMIPIPLMLPLRVDYAKLTFEDGVFDHITQKRTIERTVLCSPFISMISGRGNSCHSSNYPIKMFEK
jgi:hypothetical protein